MPWVATAERQAPWLGLERFLACLITGDEGISVKHFLTKCEAKGSLPASLMVGSSPVRLLHG